MEQEILDISSKIISSFNGFREAAKSNQTIPTRTTIGGLMTNGRFYSVEALNGLMKAAAGTIGRLLYKEDQRKKPRFSMTKFKVLCTNFFLFQYYTGLINDAAEIINLTMMMEQILGILTTFEKGGKRNG